MPTQPVVTANHHLGPLRAIALSRATVQRVPGEYVANGADVTLISIAPANRSERRSFCLRRVRGRVIALARQVPRSPRPCGWRRKQARFPPDRVSLQAFCKRSAFREGAIAFRSDAANTRQNRLNRRFAGATRHRLTSPGRPKPAVSPVRFRPSPPTGESKACSRRGGRPILRSREMSRHYGHIQEAVQLRLGG
jgi:hypothetical protein